MGSGRASPSKQVGRPQAAFLSKLFDQRFGSHFPAAIPTHGIERMSFASGSFTFSIDDTSRRKKDEVLRSISRGA
jgi:hypothetical protein